MFFSYCLIPVLSPTELLLLLRLDSHRNSIWLSYRLNFIVFCLFCVCFLFVCVVCLFLLFVSEMWMLLVFFLLLAGCERNVCLKFLFAQFSIWFWFRWSLKFDRTRALSLLHFWGNTMFSWRLTAPVTFLIICLLTLCTRPWNRRSRYFVIVTVS